MPSTSRSPRPLQATVTVAVLLVAVLLPAAVAHAADGPLAVGAMERGHEQTGVLLWAAAGMAALAVAITLTLGIQRRVTTTRATADRRRPSRRGAS